MLSVLTPTGGRPEAFAACVEMMRAQTYSGPVKWVIVDDGPEPMETPEIDGWQIVHIRPDPLWQVGQNTQARNILAGLEYATDRIIICEDDDKYAAWWLEQCNKWLDGSDLVGESHALYRNLKTGTVRPMHNNKHASLCSTAVKAAAVDYLRKVCLEGPTRIDMRLWAGFGGSRCLYPPHPRGVIGVKGWPGRAGIGIGHRL